MVVIRFGIENPVKITVAVLLVAIFGFVGLMRMPVQLTPEVEVPKITVETRWPGATPQEMEREIVDEQEEQLKSVEGLREMESESGASVGTITLEFSVGSDVNTKMLLVNNRLNQVKEYPENADRPVIRNVDSANNSPIAWFMLRPVAGNPQNVDISKFRTFAEDYVEAAFERVEGVAESNTFGGRERRLEVIVNQQELAARQITIDQLRDALQGRNKDTSAGDFWSGKYRYPVRTLGQFRSPEEVEEVIIVSRNGQPVLIRDVAQVRLGYEKPDSVVRQKGSETLAVNCLRANGANVLETMAGIQEAARQMNRTILGRQGLELVQVYDETEYINSAIGLVQSNIVVGSFLAVAVLWFFLRSIWPTLVIALAIPSSVVGTFLLVSSMGRTLNVISLAGIAFAVGMLVDNAIVVVENIFRHFEMGKKKGEAALEGTREVWGAVLASTLTTLAVFVPIVFIQEEAGQLFRDIAIAISCAVTLSLVVAMTVVPAAAARILRRGSKTVFVSDEALLARFDALGQRPVAVNNGHQSHANGSTSHVAPRTAPVPGNGQIVATPSRANQSKTDPTGSLTFLERFTMVIIAINQWMLPSIGKRLLVTVLCFGLSLGGLYLLTPSPDYLPEGNRNLVFAILIPPSGYNTDKMMEIGDYVEGVLGPYWTDETGRSAQADEEGVPAIEHFFFVARGQQLFMGARAADPTQAYRLVPLMQQAVQGIPGMFAIVQQSSIFQSGLNEGRSLEIEISGSELPKLVKLGGQVFGQILGKVRDPESTLFQAQAIPRPSLELSTPEVHINPNFKIAGDLQMTTRQLGYAVDAIVDGAYAGDFYDENNDKIDIDIVGYNTDLLNLNELGQAYLSTPQGFAVPLTTLAEVKDSTGPERIKHVARQRAITIQVKPRSEVPLGAVRDEVYAAIINPLEAGGALEGGQYQIRIAGTSDKLTEAFAALSFGLILAVMVTYLLMAGLFESWLYPIVVMLAVPTAAIGGVLALNLTNAATLATSGLATPMDILTMLGFVILIGTCVNNPILIIDQALVGMRQNGLSVRQAVLLSTATRVRPILMTTTTTLLGLLPLVLMPGAGSEIYRGLGSIVLGGLIVSTVVTLVLVPALFTLVMDLYEATIKLLLPRSQQSLSEEALVAPGLDEELVLDKSSATTHSNIGH